MLNLATANVLARYKQWADRRQPGELSREELERERPGPVSGIIAVLSHMYVVDRIWLAHLQGTEHGFRSRQEIPYPQLAELWAAQQEVDGWYVA